MLDRTSRQEEGIQKNGYRINVKVVCNGLQEWVRLELDYLQLQKFFDKNPDKKSSCNSSY